MNSRLARLALLSAVILVVGAAPAAAALSAYADLAETNDNPIPGSATAPTHEGQVEVFEYHHLMEVAGGTSTINHETVIMTMSLDDRTVPVLLQKMQASGAIKVTFHLIRPDSMGAEFEYMTVTLDNARVVSVEPLSPSSLLTDTSSLPATARVRLSYQQIQMTNHPDETSATLNNTGS